MLRKEAPKWTRVISSIFSNDLLHYVNGFYHRNQLLSCPENALSFIHSSIVFLFLLAIYIRPTSLEHDIVSCEAKEC